MEAVGPVAWCARWKVDEGGSVEMDGVLMGFIRNILGLGGSDEDF